MAASLPDLARNAATRRLRHWRTPYDVYERHAVIARLLQRGLEDAPGAVLDVGGHAGLLSRYLDRTVLAVNPDFGGHVVAGGAALPLADNAAPAVVSLDTLEHLPGDERPALIREALRVARRMVIVAAPLGTSPHSAAERTLEELYRRVNGYAHPYLAEHVAYGLPTVEDLAAWRNLPGVAVSDLYFCGDFRWQVRSFARAVRAARRPAWQARLIRGWHQIYNWRIWHPIRLHTRPTEATNRFYLVLHKARRVMAPAASAGAAGRYEHQSIS